MSFTSCKDYQETWVDSLGKSMTRELMRTSGKRMTGKLVRILEREPGA